jgi:hypothetical protein
MKAAPVSRLGDRVTAHQSTEIRSSAASIALILRVQIVSCVTQEFPHEVGKAFRSDLARQKKHKGNAREETLLGELRRRREGLARSHSLIGSFSCFFCFHFFVIGLVSKFVLDFFIC